MQSTRPGKSEMALEDVTCESLHPYWTRTNTRLDRSGGGERGQIELEDEEVRSGFCLIPDPQRLGGTKQCSVSIQILRRNTSQSVQVLHRGHL